jgi:hypothetical protein
MSSTGRPCSSACNRLPLFRARLDIKLFGKALLVGTEGELRRDHGGLAFADDLEQVHPCDGIGVGQGEITAVAEFDSNRVIVAAIEMLAHLLGTGPRDMGSAQKNDLRTIFACDNACGVVLLDSHRVCYDSDEGWILPQLNL